MTSTDSDLHVVLGASGGVGSALVRALTARGTRTRAVTRRGITSMAGVEAVRVDVTDPDSLDTALTGAAVVHHAAQPPYGQWPAQFPAMTRTILDAAARADAKLVMADNLYMYGPVPGGYAPGAPAGALREDQPQRATGAKGRVRAAMAADVLAAAGRQPVTIGRLSDYYGPGATGSAVGADLFRAALAGRAATWYVDADHPHTFSYLDDVAAALLTLAERPEADGQVFHLPAADPMTPRQFLQLVYAQAGTRARIRVLPRPALRLLAPVIPILGELQELTWQVDRPYVLDTTRYQRTFGEFAPTPHDHAIKTTLAWFTDHPNAS